MNRRHFLKHVAGAAAVTVPSLQFLQGLRARAPELKKNNKSLIIFWMGGGPSHMDLWDLKPGTQTGGEFKPIKTTADGVEISEVLPTIAEQFKHLVAHPLARHQRRQPRARHGPDEHRPGAEPRGTVPAIGSVASSLLTPKDLPLPGFIGVGGTAQRIGPGFLGMINAPFSVQNAGRPPDNIAPHSSLGNEKDQMRLSANAAASASSTSWKTTSPRAASRTSGARSRTRPRRTRKKPRCASRPAVRPRRTPPSTRRAST